MHIYERLKPDISTMATVTVKVTDTNDNAPVFDGGNERIAVFEDAPVGTIIAVLSAMDADIGPNSKLFFDFEEVFKYFEIILKGCFEI